MVYIHRRIKDNITDKQKLIHAYINIINDHNRANSLSYNEYTRLIKENFNMTVSLDDIAAYFEPNSNEMSEDIQLQIDNLGIRYE